VNDYIGALKKLPEFRITLIDLAGKYVKPDGTLDQDLMSLNIKEIEAAAREAEAYANETKKVVELLWPLLFLPL
jgi:hypothetical protein